MHDRALHERPGRRLALPAAPLHEPLPGGPLGLRLGLGLGLACALAAACAVPVSRGGAPGALSRSATASVRWEPDLPVSAPPFESVAVDWKQRIDQPYVYVEQVGSYTQIGRALEAADRAVRAQGIEPSGPPFALYYDDPGYVAPHALVARACVPVAAPTSPRAPLAYDVLESTTVVYAFVSGPYPDVPKAYPMLFEFMRSMNWVEDGPVREVYLVNPATVASFDELVCEIQVPATQRD